jgi:hypothetical protein
MRVCNFRILYFFVFFLFISIATYSQQKKYTFFFNETSLTEVIKEVSKVSGVNILYNPVILPENIRITGKFKDLTVFQALDTLFLHTQVAYKFYKKDILLYKLPDEVKETHKYTKPEITKTNTHEKHNGIITDTITYSIVTYDTVVIKQSEISKILVRDTIKVYDTVKIVQKIIKPVNFYRPADKTFAIGVFMSQGYLNSNLKLSLPKEDTTGIVKSTLAVQNSSAFGASFIYRNKSWLIETGISLTKLKYTFDYSTVFNQTVTRIDTIDKYYTSIVNNDTVWVYITEEKKVETSTLKNYLSDLSYKYLSIPLIVGYSKVVGNFTFDVKGGIVFNYYLGSKGSYLTILQDSTFQVDQSKAPGAGYSMDAFGAACIDYFLNEKVHIYTQPFISYTSFSGNTKNSSYYFNNFQIGLQVGFRYLFKL